MSQTMKMSGLERLLGVCRQNGYAVQAFPPSRLSLTPKALVCGLPLDPMLTTVYQRMSAINIKDFFELLCHDVDFDEVTEVAQLLRRRGEQPFVSSVFFGKESALAYYYATVPGLADEAGLQPVIYIDAHERAIVLPLASNVDSFFDLYARYLQAVTLDGTYKIEGWSGIPFPWSIPEMVAQDKLLVEMMRQGRFNPWLPGRDEEVNQWIEKVLVASG